MKTKTSLSKNWSKVKTLFKNIFSKAKNTSTDLKKEVMDSDNEKTTSSFKPKFKPSYYWSGENPIWYGKVQPVKRNLTGFVFHVIQERNTKKLLK